MYDGPWACEGDAKAHQTDIDPVDHPPHYTGHPSGIECIEITEHMGFCLGNALKYIWRAGSKDDKTQDLEKAIWYLRRELARGVSPGGNISPEPNSD